MLHNTLSIYEKFHIREESQLTNFTVYIQTFGIGDHDSQTLQALVYDHNGIVSDNHLRV